MKNHKVNCMPMAQSSQYGVGDNEEPLWKRKSTSSKMKPVRSQNKSIQFQKYLLNGTFENWLKEMEKENEGYLSDLSEWGATGGVAGMTYYSETTELYDKYENEIWKFLDQMADEFGQTVLEMINESAQRLDNGIYSSTDFKNYVVWFYAETKAREIIGD